jgi:excisionase family DNA binding protein
MKANAVEIFRFGQSSEKVPNMSQVIPLGPASRMLTTREAALRLGVSLRTVQLWVEASILPAARTPGGHRRIPYNAVEALAMSMGLEPLPMASQLHGAASQDAVVHQLSVEQGLQGQAANASRADRPMRIVLVSRDAAWLEASASALEVFGPSVSVCVADSGYVGLLQIGRQTPDLLVTTLELPGMDGFEMLRTLERTESLGGLRVLALTAQSPAELEARGGLPSIVEVLAMPVSPEALAIRVGRWLLTRQSRQGVHHE